MKPLRYLIALVVGLMITNAPSRAQEKRLPTLFIIGDSTVKNSTQGLQGWGTPAGAEVNAASVVRRSQSAEELPPSCL